MNFPDWRSYEDAVIDGKYYLRKMLGEGGYGGVFLADEVVADRLVRQVAIKLIEPEEGHLDRQIREIVAAANLDHPCLLRCYSPGEVVLSGRRFLYLATEVAETSLDVLLEERTLSEDEAREVASALARALEYLHGQSPPLVHCDIKPANLLRVGGAWKLGDFGLLRGTLAEGQVSAEAAAGSAAYAPPESYEGVVQPARDIWSLGVLLVEALTGALPFVAETPRGLMIAVSSQAPRLTRVLPAPFDRIVAGCLTRDLSARWKIGQVRALLDLSPSSLSASHPRDVNPSLALLTPEGSDLSGQTPPDQIVSASGDGHYRTIGEALRGVVPGTRILVRPGRYEEEIVLDRAAELVGDGPRESIVVEAVGASCLVMRTEQALVRGITLVSRAGAHHIKHPAVDIPRGNLVLQDCDISCTGGGCVSISGAGAFPVLTDCRIHGGRGDGVLISAGAQATLEECELFSHEGAGIRVTGRTHPTVLNCRIHGNRESGILVEEGGEGTLEGCDIFENAGPNVHVATQAAPMLRKCRIHDGAQAGARFREAGMGALEDCEIYGNVLSGILISNASNPRIVRCRIFEGHSNGVWVADGGYGTVEDSEIYANAFAGVKITRNGSPAFKRTTIRAGKRWGVAVLDKGRGLLVDCDIAANAGAGIRIEESGALTIRRCIVREGAEAGVLVAGELIAEECELFGNAQAGLEIVAGGSAVIRHCRLHHGRLPGILVQGGGQGTAEDCDIFENDLPNVAVGEGSQLDLRRCKIRDSKQVGLVFWAHARGTVRDCEVTGNLLGGFRIWQGADPLIRDSRITGNGRTGITVYDGGAGALTRCTLSGNQSGPLLVEAGCSFQQLDPP